MTVHISVFANKCLDAILCVGDCNPAKHCCLACSTVDGNLCCDEKKATSTKQHIRRNCGMCDLAS